MYLVCAVTVLWGLSGVLMIAFQCPSPNRWDITNPTCMDVVGSAQTSQILHNHALDAACYPDIQRCHEHHYRSCARDRTYADDLTAADQF